MIVNDDDAKARLNSPNNLINRLRTSGSSRKDAMSLFIPSASRSEKKPNFNPFIPQTPAASTTVQQKPESEQTTKLEQILENPDSQIKLGLAHDKALELLVSSVSALASKLDDVKADKLPSVIAAASKTVESIRRERNEAAKNNKDREVHYHFYTPQQNKLTDYEVIDVA